MIKQCPEVVDTQDLQFKLQCRLKIFDNVDVSTFSNVSLLTCASRYGLIFVGTSSSCFQVIQVKILANFDPKNKLITDYQRREIQLPCAPKHLAVNCDSTILAVVIEKDQCPVVIFYEVVSFLKQSIKQIKALRLSATPNIFVKEINWNPSLPGIFTACKSDGSLGVYEFKGESVDINELPAQAGATSFCWSPKGKQIAVGSKDGKITQYKPDLKAVKVIPEPKLSCPHMLITLQWVSNYQFIGVYQPTDGPSNIIVVDAPKTGEPSYTSYEDICYGSSTRPPQFYAILQQNWSFLMLASANSAEVGVLVGEGDLWTQWILPDTARAELPLSSDHRETYPVGLGFDISSTTRLPWGETTIPPCPMLLVLSHQGVLCCFNVVNLKPGVPSVCTPPDSIADVTGLSQFTQNASSLPVTREVAPSEQKPPAAVTTPMKPFFPASNLPQSTPLVANNIAPKSLFGQTTITPIKQEAQQAKVAPVKPVVVSASLAKPPQAEAKPQGPKPDAAMLAKMLKLLESDVKTLIDKGNAVVAIGSDEEMTKMTLKLENLTSFVKDAVSISQGQALEVHALKQNLFQAWTMYEQLKSQFDAGKDELMVALNQLKPLDHIAQKRKNEIKALLNYVQVQLHESSKALDEQWDEFQDYTKKTFKMKMPTMETIFQSLVKVNAVLEEQTYAVKNIARRLYGRNKKAPLDKFTDLADDMEKLRLNPATIKSIAIAKLKEREIPADKRARLRTILKNRKVNRVIASSVVPTATINKESPISTMRESILRLGAAAKLDFENTPAPKNVISSSQSAFAPLSTLESSVFKPVASSFGGVSTTVAVSKPETTSTFNFGLSTSKSVTFGQSQVKTSSSLPQQSTSTIFDNLQSVIDKATAPTTAVAVSKSTPLFGAGSAITTTTQSLFGSISTSSVTKPLFGTSTTQKAAETTKRELPPTTSVINVSLFGAKADSDTSSAKAPIFAATKAPPSTTTLFAAATSASTGFSFGSATSTSSGLFGSSNGKSLFGASTVVTSAVLSPPSTPTVASPVTPKATPPAVSSNATVTTSAGIFGGESVAATTTTTSIFAPTPTTNIFGTPPTTSANIFGSSAAKTTMPSSSNVFGTPPTTSNIFKVATIPAASVSETPTTTTAGIFGTPSSTVTFGTPSSSTSIFGTSATTTTSTTPSSAVTFGTPASTTSIFGSSTTSTTTTAPSSTVTFGTPSSSTSIFGSSPATTTTTATAFGTPTTTTTMFGSSAAVSSTTSTATTIFGTSTAVTTSSTGKTGNMFGAPATSTAFGASPSLFGAATSTATTSTASVFGAATTTSSVFGAATSTATTSTASVFGAATTTSSVFGPATATAATSTAFGAPTSPFGASTGGFGATTTSSNIFASSSGGSVFGAPSTTSANIFGTTAPSSAKSIFGGTTTGSTTTAPPFNKPTAFGTPTTTASVFGTPTTGSTTTAPPFGQTSAFGTPTTTASVFGQSAAFGAAPAFAPATTASAFGQASTFGSPSPSQSVFGAQTPTTTSGNIFGTPASSGFGSGFGAPSSGNVFGSPTTTQAPASGAFGFGGLSVGAASSGGSIFGGSSFGQSPAATANPFGKVEAKPAFGSTATNIFGTPSTSSSTNIFGSPAASTASSAFGSSTFGSPAPASAFGSTSFGGSPFGQKPAFGQPAAFGSNVFGSPQGGAFSGGSTPVAQSGFGSPASFQKPSGFGASPVFGGSPSAFGAAPTFGGGASFGGTFGSPGSAVQPEGFGTAAQQSTGFGNLANQNTIGFGNLAQQSNTSSSMPFSGSSSFSSWR